MHSQKRKAKKKVQSRSPKIFVAKIFFRTKFAFGATLPSVSRQNSIKRERAKLSTAGFCEVAQNKNKKN